MNDKYDVTEQAIKVERFVRKNKLIIIFIIICLLGAFSYFKISAYLVEKRAQDSSELYFKALLGDEVAAKELAQINSDLSAAAAILRWQKPASAPNDAFLADLALISSGENKLFLKDLNTLKSAYAALLADDINKAHSLAKSISNNSNFYALAQRIIHYKAAK